MINDYGKNYVHVTAATALEAFDAATSYVAAKYPDDSFIVEGPFYVGVCNGYVTGVGYILRAVKAAAKAA